MHDGRVLSPSFSLPRQYRTSRRARLDKSSRSYRRRCCPTQLWKSTCFDPARESSHSFSERERERRESYGSPREHYEKEAIARCNWHRLCWIADRIWSHLAVWFTRAALVKPDRSALTRFNHLFRWQSCANDVVSNIIKGNAISIIRDY